MLCFKSGRCSLKMKLSFENSFLNIIFVPFQSSSENNLRRYMKTCSICKQREKKTHKTCVQNYFVASKPSEEYLRQHFPGFVANF